MISWLLHEAQRPLVVSAPLTGAVWSRPLILASAPQQQ